MSGIALHEFSWERMILAVEDVKARATRAAAALRASGIPFLIVGGHAVAAWVARVDVEAVRNTKDVDLLIRRDDLPRVVGVLQPEGFVHQNVAGVDVFLDGPEGSIRSAIHILFAAERVRPEHPLPAPEVTEAEPGTDFPVPTLDALVRMKLNSFRLKDKVHLIDLIDVGLIDASWSGRLPVSLAERLRELFEERDRELDPGDTRWTPE